MLPVSSTLTSETSSSSGTSGLWFLEPGNIAKWCELWLCVFLASFGVSKIEQGSLFRPRMVGDLFTFNFSVSFGLTLLQITILLKQNTYKTRQQHVDQPNFQQIQMKEKQEGT